ncbi:MAG: NTP transferase domain-containing protein [Spirochaetales bacterium]|nr:NTP transferase domain-containing protein [Spirochaetales bacterium]
MRYAVIMAGGSGTRLWPMSRRERPKQLLPLMGGRSLLQLALDRLEGLIAPENTLVCAAEADRGRIRQLLGISDQQFLGEPVGRDTLPALAYSAAVVAGRDPDAVVGVFTADHLIEPVQTFRSVVEAGFQAIERRPEALLTFGIAPTHPATGYGYLELGDAAEGATREVRRFKEKPDLATARRYFQRGPGRYLWNSGMFVWKTATFLACVERFAPSTHAGIQRIAAARDARSRARTVRQTYPTLDRISVDYGIMEPASADPEVPILALPMALQWRDIGSWTSYGDACASDADGNAAPSGKSTLVGCRGTFAASTDPSHLIAAVGCEDLIIVHTDNATLVCPKDRAEEIKALQAQVLEEHGEEYV